MEISEYFEEKKDIHRILLDFIEDESNPDECFQKYIILIQKYQGLEDNLEDLKEYLHLISNIADNHSRQKYFFDKIERLLMIFKDKMMNYFSNYEIFDIFKKNKKILLWLFENKVIKADECISQKMMSEKYSNAYYPFYFFNEIKEFIEEEKKQKIEDVVLLIT